MSVPRLGRSLRAAWAGLAFIFDTQLNWRIHLGLGCVAGGLGLLLQVSAAEWAVLAGVMGLVLALEAMNTAVEAAVDAIPVPRSLTTMHAKDAAAASVLVGAFTALAVGGAVFIPKLVALLR